MKKSKAKKILRSLNLSASKSEVESNDACADPIYTAGIDQLTHNWWNKIEIHGTSVKEVINIQQAILKLSE